MTRVGSSEHDGRHPGLHLRSTDPVDEHVAWQISAEMLADAERDRSDAIAWRRFESAGFLTRLWLAVRA